ncbi:MAG: exodeoxyribonuclease VII large subunit [Gammaproteobacteria bacterium]|nr:exodeoxyribonuclease VII large subunit [Gammaproteobacteria bacterium]
MPPAESSPPERIVYSVSRLLQAVRQRLETGFPLLWLEGEISNFARPASGHFYFTLKDEAAQVRCAMFRNRNQLLRFQPRNGLHILVRARVSLYEARGEFQLIIEHLEEAGTGALRQAFEALKARLAGEGLFDAAHRRPLPALPRRLGVITSPTGAAVRDILSVLARRFPALPVLIYPVPVQGEAAAAAIVETLRLAGERQECDVLILARGGGSLEDLQPFNEERVARAIRACPIPVVSGVGHEVDVTIADFAADRRAPTPSAAAELVAPDRAEWLTRLAATERRLGRLAHAVLTRRRERVEWLRLRLQHPGQRLIALAQRLDELEQRMGRAQGHILQRRAARLAELSAHLRRHAPLHRLHQLRQQHGGLALRLEHALANGLARRREQLAGLARGLHAVSPLATLERGYAIATHAGTGAVLRDARQAPPGTIVETRLAHGRLRSRVEMSLGEENDEKDE